jgi:L-xylulokinase
MGKLVLGLDCGLTVTKAVLFDETGRPRATASARVPQESPQPRWLERDIDALWTASAGAIRSAIEQSGAAPQDVIGVGVTAHGDGLYLLDADGRPTRPGILSLDSRAHGIVERWEAEGRFGRMLEVTGQVPGPLSPAALLTWVAENEPRVFERSRWALPCKDVMKLRLTGEVSTDQTEASTSFCDVRTQTYTAEALAVYDLEDRAGMLAPVVGCTEVMGKVTPEAAAQTGLAPGTPVVAGLHDVDACAIGIGSLEPGQLTLIAGTASINEVISDQPIVDERWFCRNFVRPGQWMNMSLSLSSATNLEWFVQRLCQADVAAAVDRGEDPFAFVEREVAAVADDPGDVLFLPFLYGSPHGAAASGTFLGMRGWHNRGHLLRAVLEGVVFNHRTHVDALRDAFGITEGRLTGGAVRSRRWSQMFADALGVTVLITDSEESGALGTAMCAAVGTGMHGSLEEAAAASVRVTERLEPDAVSHEQLEAKYAHYRRVIDALADVWDAPTVPS